MRVPVLVGHSEAIWVELEAAALRREATEILSEAPSVRVLELPEFPTPRDAAGIDDVLVGRIRADTARENGLSLFLASDNLRKGAALNAIQIAELLLSGVAPRPSGQGRGGTGAGTGVNASWTTRSTRARRPSSTGCKPASSSRTSSTLPCERTVSKPKSARKSRGKTVRWTMKRSNVETPTG